MKKRNVILFLGVLVASIIGTKTFADPVKETKSKEIGVEEVDRIIKTIKDNPEFSLFYEAIKQAELSEQIAKLDQMTLMIPNNKAFKMLPEDVWENFMDEENKEELVQLLNYHVIPEKVNYDDLRELSKLETLNSQSVNISHDNDIKIETAVVKEKYEETRDVIVYQIDGLIMPLK